MAGRRGVENGDVLAVFHGFEHGRYQIAGVQHDGLARLQINLHAVLIAQVRDAADERFHVVIGAGDVVTAAEVEPLHALHVAAEAHFERRDRAHEVVRVLFAEGVEVEAFDAVEHIRLEIRFGNAEARGRAARVIDGVALRLGRALRIEAQAAALSRDAGEVAVFFPLGERIEHDMVGVFENFTELVRRVGRRVYVRFAAEFLVAQTRLVQTGRGRAGEVFAQQRIGRKHGKRLLRKQDLRAGTTRDIAQHRKVLHKAVFVNDKAGSRKIGKSHISPPAPACHRSATADPTCSVLPCTDRDRTPQRCTRPVCSTCRSAALLRRSSPERRWCS